MAQTALGYATKYRAGAPTKRKPPKNKDLGKNLTTSEVAKLTGATLRQLQWWDEQNLITVRQDGHSRIYTLEDARRVKTVVELRKRGISLQQCRKLMKHETLTVQGIIDALDVLRKLKVRVRIW
jgi:DNA-binding transcriptional MerR regulator